MRGACLRGAPARSPPWLPPRRPQSLIAGIKRNVEGIDDVVLSSHCHNDLGQAASNTLMGGREGGQAGCCKRVGGRAGAACERVVRRAAAFGRQGVSGLRCACVGVACWARRPARTGPRGPVPRAQPLPPGWQNFKEVRNLERNQGVSLSPGRRRRTLAPAAAAVGGARQLEVTINGIGERAGNASAEEVIMAIALRG